jgi:hypothetical protein
VIKSVLTVAALGTTMYSGILGSKITTEGGSAPVEGGTVPSSGTPDQVGRTVRNGSPTPADTE